MNVMLFINLNESVEAPHEVVWHEIKPAPLPVDDHGGVLKNKQRRQAFNKLFLAILKHLHTDLRLDRIKRKTSLLFHLRRCGDLVFSVLSSLDRARPEFESIGPGLPHSVF